MTRIQRQIFARSAIVGALITLTVIAADVSGFLSPTENWLYDLRARHFQFAGTKPTDKLVHVDIDDKALDVTGVGTWPWPRAKLAGILDEMRLAGVKAVALDVIYSEAQDAPPPSTQPDASRKPGNDEALAEAIRKLNCVVVPAALSFEPPDTSPVYRAMIDQFRSDPEQDENELSRRLSTQITLAAFLEARKEGMYQRITQEMLAAPRTHDELLPAVLKSKQIDLSSPVSRVFDQQFNRFDSIHSLEQLCATIKPGAPPLPKGSMHLPPIPIYTHVAAATGFVDYKTGRDGVLRSIPLLADHDGFLVPQMGLSLAMLTLGVLPRDVAFDEHSVTLACPDGRHITIRTHGEFNESQGHVINSILDIPWFGSADPLTMYDWPARQVHTQHMSITNVWDACDIREKIIKNNRNAAEALNQLKDLTSLPVTDAGDRLDHPDVFRNDIDKTLTDLAEIAKPAEALKPSELDADSRVLVTAMRILRLVQQENPRLAEQLRQQRQALSAQLGGRSVLIGRIATGQVDITPTSIHAQCPGVIAHGAIFNAIMTGVFWTRAPAGVTIAITLVLGLIAALLATWLSPLLGLLITLLLAGGYILFNGYVLFDRGDLLVGMAGPLTALGTVWAGCTLNRIIMEVGERKRITSRFGSYVDPTLVSYVLDNPDQVRFEGDTRELTVVFTDLAGFTTLSETLGEATVPLLNEYFGRMVPIIRSKNGYVNKFLGDGIMFFFGAPIPKSNHAHQAVATVLEMQQAMEDFNRELLGRGMEPLGMRAGISTGMMVVGDAGTSDRTDYTVLGDIVNLGARLEGANKATGTKILVNDRTAELIRDQYLLRPIGALQVKGKAVWVMTYEPIALVSEVTDRQKKLVDLTGALVDAFIPGDFQQCLVAADKLEAEFGPSPLAAIYREHCRHNIEKPPEAFDGRIELTEK